MKAFSIGKLTLSRGGRHLAAGMLAAGLLWGLGSCAKETAIDGPVPPTPAPEEKVSLALATNMGSFQTPVSRAGMADEESTHGTGRMPIVLVFEHPTNGSNMNMAGFKEAVLAEVADPETPSDPALRVTLSLTDKPVRLLVVANPPTHVFDGVRLVAFTPAALNDSGSILKGKVFSRAVQEFLYTEPLPEQTTEVPYARSYIPMTGIIDLPAGITPSMTAIGTVSLERIVAKITVETDEESGFILEGATVVRTKAYGYLYNNGSYPPAGNQVDYLSSVSANQISDVAPASGGSTANHPLYVYESDAGEAVVIVQGFYDNTRYFYRLGLKSGGPTGEILPIYRNKHYKVSIRNITRPGYSFLQEAIAAEGYSNIQYDVHVTDLSGHEIQDNGSYYLGVSNSEYWYYSYETNETVTVATISTDVTTASGVPIRILKMSGPTGITFDDMIMPGSSEGSYNLDMQLSASLTEDTPLVVRVELGNLVKDITIRRKTPLSSSAGSHLFEGPFVHGRIESPVEGWSLSPDGITESGDELVQPAGPIYLKTTYNGSWTRSSDIYLFSQQENARIKAYVIQRYTWASK